MTKKQQELHDIIEKKDAEIKEMKSEMTTLYHKALMSGVFMSDEPFIPEYAGFDSNEIRDNSDVLICRVYSKDGFSISRYVSVEKKEWIIVRPDGSKFEILINNMEVGIKLLQAAGMDISIENYLMQKGLSHVAVER